MVDSSRRSCRQHLVEAMASVSDDRQALSDVVRPHRAYERGYERTRVDGVSHLVQFEVKAPLITWADVELWLVKMANVGMRAQTLSAYRSCTERAFAVVSCNCGEAGDEGPRTPSGSIAPGSRVGFKLSTCQKALSLALKHAWSQGVVPKPPVCPVDRIVLNAASAITGKPWKVNWTDVNSLEQYEAHLGLLGEAAGFRDLASWEMMTFEQLLPTHRVSVKNVVAELAIDDQTRIPQAKASFIQRFGGGIQGTPSWYEQMLKDALRSSMQHNGTYLPTVPNAARVEVRLAMRRHITLFLQRWEELPDELRNLRTFEDEMLRFREAMNDGYSRYFR